MLRMIVPILIATSVGQIAVFAQGSTPNSVGETADREAVNEEFTQEERVAIQEASKNLKNGHAGETLLTLIPISEAHPNSRELRNMIGVCYVQMRQLARAEEIFQSLSREDAIDPKPRFNLAELAFVKRRFSEAEKGFASLLKDYPIVPEAMRHMIHYKLILCRLSQDKDANVENILKEFTYKDETPAYYMSRVAIFIIQNDREKASEWLMTAERIYAPMELEIYLDSLHELDLIPSLEGGGIDLTGGTPSVPEQPATGDMQVAPAGTEEKTD